MSFEFVLAALLSSRCAADVQAANSREKEFGSPARASYGASMRSPGSRYRTFENHCCQICPSRFMTTLSFMEVSENEKKQAISNFAAWHRQFMPMEADYQSQPVTSDLALIESSESANPTATRPIPPLYTIEPGPCCPICPSFFMNRYNDQRKEGSALQYHRQESDSYWQSSTGFLELQQQSHATINSGFGQAVIVADTDSTWRKKGRPPQPFSVNPPGNAPQQSVPGSFVEVNARSGAGKIDFPELQCCNVCISQFYAPLEYDDEEVPELVMGPGTKMGFVPTQKAATSCCEACAANLNPRQRHGVKVPGMDDSSSSSYRKAPENVKTMGPMYDQMFAILGCMQGVMCVFDKTSFDCKYIILQAQNGETRRGITDPTQFRKQ